MNYLLNANASFDKPPIISINYSVNDAKLGRKCYFLCTLRLLLLLLLLLFLYLNSVKITKKIMKTTMQKLKGMVITINNPASTIQTESTN